MPSKTPKQARAMRAAAVGKSSIGIPKSVGKEFVAADSQAKPATTKAPAKSVASVFVKK